MRQIIICCIKKIRYVFRSKKQLREWKRTARQMENAHNLRQNEPIYYVITCDVGRVGLFSYVNTIMSEVNAAVTAGWIPVIDLQSYPSTYLEQQYVGIKNAWEYFFEQPGRTSLEDAKQTGNYLTADQEFTNPGPYSGAAFYEDFYGEKTYWRLLAKQYLRLQPSIRERIEMWIAEHWKASERILGVLCRGTDYVVQRPKNHPVQPTLDEMVIKAKKLRKAWNCHIIYLCTEDAQILERFRQEFRDRITYLNKNYIRDIGTKQVAEITYEREDDVRRQGEEYLIQIGILARCQCLLAGPCGGTVGAELLTDGYEHEYVWNLGVYQ